MKPIVPAIVAICAFLAFIAAAICMPAAELLPAHVEPGSIAPGLSPVRSVPIMNAFADIGSQLGKILYPETGGEIKKFAEGSPLTYGAEQAPGELRAYAMWAVFLALAMTFAAIGLLVVGRLEAEEKTVLPVKK